MARRQTWSVGELIIERGGGIRIEAGTGSSIMRIPRAWRAVPATLDVDRIVTSCDMRNGAYTIAQAKPVDGLAHNVTVSQTITNASEDTNGTVVVVGKDLNGNRITETLTPNGGATVEGLKAFAEVTSITGSGWVIQGADEDTITFGFGDVLGLPECLDTETDIMLYVFDNTVSAPATPTHSLTSLADNTVKPVGDGSKVLSIIYLPASA